MRKKFVHILWALLATTVLVVALMFTAIWNGWIGYMPDVEDLQNPIDRYATQVYSADGKVLGTWSLGGENRVRLGIDKVSNNVVQALVATEDVRFYSHSGIDFIALARAVVKRGLLGQASAGGGSTITQQLAKQLWSEKAHSTIERLMQKPIEWVIAVKLERYFTKEDIVMMYLNQFDFLHNAVGIKTAAATYFSKEAKDLTIDEAAVLVGLCKNPAYFNPVRHPDRARERRNVVLAQMEKAGYITERQCDTLQELPITLHFQRTDHKDGSATYVREFLRRYLMAERPNPSNYQAWQRAQYVADSIAWQQDPLYGWCHKNTKRDGTSYNIYSDGLRVYTTIDSRMQQYAEESAMGHVARYLQPAFDRECRHKPNAPFTDQLTPKQVRDILTRNVRQSDRYRAMQAAGYSEEEINKAFRTPTDMTVFSYNGEIDTVMTPIDSIRYYKRFLRTGFVSMEAKTGAVKAYVGGLDFAHFQYDMVMEGRRQVGSTIKPLLYSLAMENGFTPCDRAPNVQQTYIVAGQPWTPRNASRSHYGESVTLKWGLAQSNNWISAYLMSKLDPHQFVDLLREYGISNPDIHPSMALCLGPCDLTVGELVSAYTTFANHGIRCAPMFVTRIEDNDGHVLARFQPRVNEVISEQSAYKMLVLLQGVVDGGTGGRMRFKYDIRAQMGGKTGTTNRNSDTWFVGVTPDLITGCWVGGEDRDIHFDSMIWGQGATMALPVVAYFLKKLYRDPTLPYRPDATFEIAEGFDPCAGSHSQDDMAIDDVYE